VARRTSDRKRLGAELGVSMVPQVRRRARRSLIASGIVSIALVVAYFLLPLNSDLTTTTVVTVSGGIVLIAALLVWHLRSIISSPYPRVRAVAALATTIPLFLVVFATSYFVMGRTQPANFSEHLSRLDSAYYTVTVFATVGFGDIVPKTEVARTVTMIQMMGDIVLVGLVVQVIVGAVRTGLRRQETDTATTVVEEEPR
jgi:voltage-gated potassium channel